MLRAAAFALLVAVAADPIPPPGVGWRGVETGASFLAMTHAQREQYVTGVFDGLLIAPVAVTAGAVGNGWLEACADRFDAGEVAEKTAAEIGADHGLRERAASLAVWNAVVEYCGTNQ